MADRRDLGRASGLLVLAVVAVVVIGFGAGLLFGRSSPERAASALLDEFADDTAPPPTTAAEPRCGLSETAVDGAVLDAMRAAGGVAVAYTPGVVDVPTLRRLVAAFPDTLLVVPDPDLDARVVARSRTRVLALDAVDERLLGAFTTAYGQPVCGRGATSSGD